MKETVAKYPQIELQLVEVHLEVQGLSQTGIQFANFTLIRGYAFKLT